MRFCSKCHLLKYDTRSIKKYSELFGRQPRAREELSCCQCLDDSVVELLQEIPIAPPDQLYEDPYSELEDLGAALPPENQREREAIQAYIERDRSIVDDLKQKYGYRCQVCDFTFTSRFGNPYAEGAHIIPFSILARANRIDLESTANLIVMCPNHHQMFDLGAMRILGNEGVFTAYFYDKGPSMQLKVKHNINSNYLELYADYWDCLSKCRNEKKYQQVAEQLIEIVKNWKLGALQKDWCTC